MKGTCKNCTNNNLQIKIPQQFKNHEVKYSQWRSEKKKITKKQKGKVVTLEKTIFNLYPDMCELKKAVETLQEMYKNLRIHIFTAYKQWDAHEQGRRNLDMNTFISIEDYQMNVTVVYSENPTSMAYSSNKHTVAMYPICIEYLDDNGVLIKGAITFISDDKDHCHQQVQKFEERMMEILQEKWESIT